MAVEAQGWEQDFIELDAVWQASGEPSPDKPHPATSMSGKHIVRAYFNSDIIIRDHPEVVGDVIENKWAPELQSRLFVPKWFVGYRPFSDGLAAAAADVIGGLSAYSDPDSGYRIDAQFAEGDTAVVVADDMYTGGAVTKTIERLEEQGVRVLGAVLCLANMSGNSTLGDREIISAAAFEADARSAADCPHCAIGSVALLPRPYWDVLQGRAS